MSIIRYFLALLLIFILEKPAFMLYAGEGFQLGDVLQVIWHGLPVDASVAAYLSFLPLVLMLVAAIFEQFPIKKVLKAYNAAVGVLLALIFVGDAVLYPYWGFKLDSSVFFYLRTPGEALASVSFPTLALCLIVVVALSVLFALLLSSAFRNWRRYFGSKYLAACAFFVTLALLAVVARGGFKQSCMNVGHAYFSDVQFLNHSAVNPAFSIFDSMGTPEEYGSKYHFMDEEERARLADPLFVSDSSFSDSLLNTTRPNVLFVILEGFGADFVKSLGGLPDVAPNLDSLTSTGVFFRNCYAGSFRTDRGVVCLLNGYPGLPVTSLMKLPSKNRGLPSIAKSLGAEGYSSGFIYGGDVNFTDMKSYLYAGGYGSIVSDVDFPAGRGIRSRWGVYDEYVFNRLYEEVAARGAGKSPWFLTCLTLSSHEPFDVPSVRFDDPEKNAFAYADGCLGDFVRKLSVTPAWKNLLVVIVPDHGYCRLQEGHRQAPHVHHIPMLWIGGAVRRPAVVDALMNQSDLPATLLAQMGLDASRYKFSRNVLSGSYSAPSAFYSYIDGFCYLDGTGASMYDNVSGRGEYSTGHGDSLRIEKGKAVLQTLYENIDRL